MQNFTNYKFFQQKNKVIAVSTFAGKTVRGVAICSEHDAFDPDKGMALAAARCNEKVAAKRVARAEKKLMEARAAVEVAEKRLEQMMNYSADSYIAYNEAAQAVDKLIKSL